MVGGHLLYPKHLRDLPPGVPVHGAGPEHDDPRQPRRADEQRRRAARCLGEPRCEAGLREVLPARPAAAQQGVQPPDRVVEQHRVPGHAEHADAELIRIFKDKRPAAQLADAQTQCLNNAKDNAQHQLRALGFRLTLTAHPAEQHGQPRGGRPPGPAVQRKILVQHDQRRKPAGHGVKVEARCLVLHADQQIRAGGLPVRHRNDGGQCYRAQDPQQQRRDNAFCFLLHPHHLILYGQNDRPSAEISR